MRSSPRHLAILVGASPACETLRRAFVRREHPHAGLARDVASLRRLLHRAAPDLSVLCVSLDGRTVARHGHDLEILLRDARSFPGTVRSLGLVAEPERWAICARLGLDLHASSADEAAEMIELLAGSAHTPAHAAVRFAEFRFPTASRRFGARAGHRLVAPPDLATDLEGPELP